jgi:hypothetical protein
VTTIQGRSFAGLVVAHLALTVVVCGGFVWLPPAPAPSHDFRTTLSAVFDCSASADSSRDHQLTGETAALNAPAWDAGDDDDGAPAGSDVAIAVDRCETISRGDAIEAVHIKLKPWISRRVERSSLRAPPADDDTSSDADLDNDNDDDPCAEYSAPLPPAPSHELWTLTPAAFVSLSSVRSSNLSLRAPPL